MKMKMNKTVGSLVAILAGVAFYLPTHTLAAAFGVSPPWIENENLKPGSSFVYIINLSSNDLSQDMLVTAKVTGDPEIAEWLKVRDNGNMVMTQGKAQVPMYVDLTIPSTAKLGKYSGALSLGLTPKTAPGKESIAVLLGANIAVKLNVINHDVTDFWVQSITADNVKEDQPIRLNVRVKNDGNTDVLSVPVQVQVLDGNTQKLVAEGTADRLMAPVLPHTLSEVAMDVPVPHLVSGNYWVKASAMKGTKPMYENKLYFSVEPLNLNNVLRTEVEVANQGARPAAMETVPSAPQFNMGGKVDLRTTVTVRAPFTNSLILIVIGLLLVIVGFVGRIFYSMRKKNVHHHFHR